MIWKYARKECTLYWKVNGIIFFQLLFTFAVTILCAALATSELRYYRGVSRYYEKDGYYVQAGMFTDPNQVEVIRDSEDLKNHLKSAEVYGYCDVDNLGCTLGPATVSVKVRAYDEAMVRQFRPEMKSGRWIGQMDDPADAVSAVVTQNNYGISPGDVVSVVMYVGDGGDGDRMVSVPVKITGLIGEGTEIFGESLPPGDDVIYKCCYEKFQMRSTEYPMLLVSRESLLSAVKRQSNLPLSMSLTGSCFITYHDGITEAEKTYNLNYIKDYGIVGPIESLPAASHSSKLYLREKMLWVAPPLAGAMIFAMLGLIGIRAITTDLQLPNYRVYQICGLNRRKCCLVNLAGNGLLTAAALVVAFAVILSAKMLPIPALDLVVINGWHMVAGVGIMAVNLAVSSILPLIIICKSC